MRRIPPTSLGFSNRAWTGRPFNEYLRTTL